MKAKNKTSRISEGDKTCVSSAQLTCWVCCTLSQFSHSKRLPLSWDIWWRMRLDFQLKALGHWSHLYSLSSVCTIMCCPRLDKESTSSLVCPVSHTSHICSPQDKCTVCVECVHFYEHYSVVSVYLYSFGKIFSQSLHSWTGSSLSSRSCLKSSLSVSKMEPVLEHEYFWCRRSSSVEENSSSQSSQRYICSSAHTHTNTHRLVSHNSATLYIQYVYKRSFVNTIL